VTDIAAGRFTWMCSSTQGASFTQPIPAGHTTVAYVYEGKGEFGVGSDGHGEAVEAVQMVVFSDGDHLTVQVLPDSSVSS